MTLAAAVTAVLLALPAVNALPTVADMGHVPEVARAVPAVVGVIALLGLALGWPRSLRHLAGPALSAATTSLIATAAIVGGAVEAGRFTGLPGAVELVTLLVLLGFVARWSPPRTALAVGSAVAAAATCWVLRTLPAYEPLAVVGGLTSMAVAPSFSIALGGYSRLASTRLDRSLREARQAQRLELAHDLHDYVAHDVSGIVAQAQAARFAHPGDAERLATSLEHIEATGLRALSVMDEMVDVLSHDDPAAPLRPPPRLGELAGLVDRFREERLGACTVEFSQDLAGHDPAAVPPAAQAAAHRVVVEALTNVRRHAGRARRVGIGVRTEGDDLVVRVRNDLPEDARHDRRVHGGTGLAGLRDRVQNAGGRFVAGPDDEGGWLVEAWVPLRGRAVRATRR